MSPLCTFTARSAEDFANSRSRDYSKRDQLDAIGFVWDISEYKFDILCDALVGYSKFESRKNGNERDGALKIPAKFVVPSDSEWPNELWGYKLGEKCVAVRQKELYVKGYPERLKVLADLGFQIGGNDSLSWLKVVHAGAIYSQMNRRKLQVPQTFVVPAPPRLVDQTTGIVSKSTIIGSDDAWPWPGKIAFMKLVRVLYSSNSSRIAAAFFRISLGISAWAETEGYSVERILPARGIGKQATASVGRVGLCLGAKAGEAKVVISEKNCS